MKRSPFLSTEVRRGYLLGLATALAAWTALFVPEAIAREDQYKRQEVAIKSADGKALGENASLLGAHVPMCFSDACLEITASNVADGGTVTLEPGQWYEVTTTSDNSGAIAGCWANGTALASCTAKPRLKDGVIKPMAWPASVDDAGVLGGKAKLFFLSSTTTTFTAVFCPEVPCR